MIRRHYLYTPSGRRVHLRWAGDGPPLVMCHPSPGSSWALEPLMEALAGRRQVIALDTPGYGESEALPIEDPSIPDYAGALLDALDALEVADPVDLYGSHTGAKIALQLAVEHPGRISRLVLDGIGLHTAEEREDLLARYTPPLTPDPHGTHLVRAWGIRRDMVLFWPWYRHEPRGRLLTGLPTPEALHHQTVDLLRAGERWGKGYRAAFRFDAEEPLRGLTVETLLVAGADDPLRSHLGRGGLPASVTVARPETPADLAARIEQFLDPGRHGPIELTPPDLLPGELRRSYADADHGQLLLRRSGGDGRPVVMFHQSPTSGAALLPLASELARHRPVIVFDTPGNGDSSPLPGEPTIADLATAMASTLDRLGIGGFDLFGSHTGALIALELAVRRPDLVHRVVLEGVLLQSDEEQARQLASYPPPMVVDRHGAHLIWAWNFMRDMTLFWPWYDQTADAARPWGPPPPQVLHDRVLELLKGGLTYHHQYRAAFAYPTADRLPRVQVPVLLCAGPTDPLLEGTRRAVELVPDGEFQPLPAGVDPPGIAGILTAFWDAADG